ncbi:hypothetical protein BX265_4986 [Streptomyces sp. TLI_235]|nr:hypothetical protein [Streptomyces sp. TLI_235]PBC80150.1 hypothetical protein BX265_4986 [Streptomyces sp. TLI_235]
MPTRTDRTPDETAALAELADLHRAVTRGLENTPYHLGQPTTDLAAGIALHVAAYLGSVTGDIPRLIRRLKAEPKRLRWELSIARGELRTLRAGLRAAGADPTQLQNLWAQIHMRNRQWREAKAALEDARARIAAVLALPVATSAELRLMDGERYHHALGYAQALADVARAINTATAPTS